MGEFEIETNEQLTCSKEKVENIVASNVLIASLDSPCRFLYRRGNGLGR